MYNMSNQTRLVAISLIALTSATNLQLTSVQPIVGFSTPCFTAYSQRLPSCSFDDLKASVGGKNGGCSVACMADLTSAQTAVQRSCQGERASRQTVIGQMFLGAAVNFLCPNGAGESPSLSTQSTTTTIAVPTTTMSTAAPVDSSTLVTSVASTSAQETTTAGGSTTSTQAEESSTTSDTATPSATSGANNDDDRGDGEDGNQTTFAGAGGGSPFDGGPGDFDGAAGRLSLGTRPLHLVATFFAILFLAR